METLAIISGMIAFAAFWARIEHRLTVIETNCKLCNRKNI